MVLSGEHDRNLIKFKPFYDAEYTVKKFNETFKGSGILKSARVLVNFETGRSRWFTVPATDWTEEKRRQVYADRHLYYAKHGDTEFDPKYKAIVSSVGIAKNGVPLSPRLVGFRHRDDELVCC